MSRFLLVLAFSLAFPTSPVAAGGQPDPATTVGPTKCAECHKAQTRIWEGTHHFSSYSSLPRSEDARKIADAMGIRRLKADSSCLDCHFLQVLEDGEPEAVAGIACESCHGGAAGWLERHSEFSGHETAEQESDDERAARWTESEAAGMIRPGNVYRLAKNCYGCHLVPREDLVNRGGHTPGSDFELVAWSQGEVRHNTWESGDTVNEVPTPERLRILYVTGALVELEEALRGTSLATENAEYGVAMARRADAARKRVRAIADAVEAPQLVAIAEAAEAAELRLSQGGQLAVLADEISSRTRDFLAEHDGSTLGGVDPMLPSPSTYKGTPAAVPGVEDAGAR